MPSVFDLMATLSLDSANYEKGLDEAKKSGLSKLGGGLAAAGKAGAVAIGAATAAVGAFAVSSVNAGKDFDAAMAQVAATMGVSADEVQDLNQFAQEMGRQTKFSATESAKALNYMALAGYDAETSMSMLPNVLNLAAAGGFDLARASDMVTDAQSALGLSLDETREMVDKMARASSKSNTSVEQLGDAFLTIGGTAKNLSGGTTELATALGILADNGIKGAEGGTALRNILLNLTPKSEDAAAAMEQIGLNAYDAQGNMRPLADIFADMNEGMKDMTTQEKVNVLSNIFNKVDLKSINALLATNVDRWEDLSAEIDNAQGAAQAMADTQLDNLAGDITIFQSALEGAKIAISNRLTPSLRNLVKFGTDGISDMTAAFEKNGLNGALEVFNEYVDEAVQTFADKFPQILETVTTVVGGFMKSITKAMPSIIKTIGEALVDISGEIIDYIPDMVDSGVDLFLSLAEGLTEALPDIVSKLGEAVTSIAVSLSEHTGEILTAGIDFFLTLGESLLKAIPDIVKQIPVLVENVALGLLEGVEHLFTEVEGIFLQRSDLLSEKEHEIIDAIHEERDAMDELMQKRQEQNDGIDAEYDHYTNLLTQLESMVDENGKVKEGYEDRVAVITGVLNEAFGLEISLIGDTITNYQEMRAEVEKVIATEKARALLQAEQEEYAQALQNQNDAYNTMMGRQAAVDLTTSQLHDSYLALQTEIDKAAEEESAHGQVSSETQSKIQDLNNTIASQEEALAEQKTALAESKQTYSDYMAVIDQNEGLMAAVAEGDVGKMNQAINDLTSDFRTAETSTKEDLESQVRNTEDAMNNMAKAFKNGDQRITDDMVKDAINRYDRANLEMQKYKRNAETNAVDTGDIYNKKLKERYETAVADAGTFRGNLSSTLGQTRDFITSGINITNGLKQGIDSGTPGVMSKVSGLVSSIKGRIQRAMDMHSPSKWMAWVGRMMDEGLGKGIEENAPIDEAEQMIKKVAESAEGAFSPIEFSTGGGYGGMVVNMTVNGAEGQDVDELASVISEKITEQYNRRRAVYA